jgi:hypothetical protein
MLLPPAPAGGGRDPAPGLACRQAWHHHAAAPERPHPGPLCGQEGRQARARSRQGQRRQQQQRRRRRGDIGADGRRAAGAAARGSGGLGRPGQQAQLREGGALPGAAGRCRALPGAAGPRGLRELAPLGCPCPTGTGVLASPAPCIGPAVNTATCPLWPTLHAPPPSPRAAPQVVVQRLSTDFRAATALVSAPLPAAVPPGQVLIRRTFVGINASDVNFSAGAPPPAPPAKAGAAGRLAARSGPACVARCRGGGRSAQRVLLSGASRWPAAAHGAARHDLLSLQAATLASPPTRQPSCPSTRASSLWAWWRPWVSGCAAAVDLQRLPAPAARGGAAWRQRAARLRSDLRRRRGWRAAPLQARACRGSGQETCAPPCPLASQSLA